jgi:hypothetical protein
VDGALTRSVGADDSDPEPNSFVAVTRERTRKPTSSPVSVYEDEAAPSIGVHTSSRQRNQTHANVSGAEPVH